MNPPHDYFLGHPLRVSALAYACASWRGTPFRQKSAVKGPQGGVDCAGFVAAVFLEIEAIDQAIAVPPYDLNHAEHSDLSLFHDWFAQPAVRARVRVLDEAEPHLDGDFVFPVVGRCEHHIGIRIGPLVWHVARPSGVCAMTIAQLKLHRSRYRLLEAADNENALRSSAGAK